MKRKTKKKGGNGRRKGERGNDWMRSLHSRGRAPLLTIHTRTKRRMEGGTRKRSGASGQGREKKRRGKTPEADAPGTLAPCTVRAELLRAPPPKMMLLSCPLVVNTHKCFYSLFVRLFFSSPFCLLIRLEPVSVLKSEILKARSSPGEKI